jgi:NUDIX domain
MKGSPVRVRASASCDLQGKGRWRDVFGGWPFWNTSLQKAFSSACWQKNCICRHSSASGLEEPSRGRGRPSAAFRAAPSGSPATLSGLDWAGSLESAVPISPYLAKLRRTLGSELLLLPSVTIIVFDEEGRVLLVQPSDVAGWVAPGGSIEPGESPADAPPVGGPRSPRQADRNQFRRRRQGPRSARSLPRARSSAAPPRRPPCGDVRGRASSRRRARPRRACRRSRS